MKLKQSAVISADKISKSLGVGSSLKEIEL